MIETEKKYVVESHDVVEVKLEKLGYKVASTQQQIDTYYSLGNRDFMATKECLRVREEDGKAELTYKPASSGAMKEKKAIWKKETNIPINTSDTGAAKDFLKSLECEELCVVDKTRTEYKKQGSDVTVALDVVVDAGDFVEIEVLADVADSKLLDQINELALELGLSESNEATLPYRDLVMGY